MSPNRSDWFFNPDYLFLFHFLLLDCRVPQNGSGWFFTLTISFFFIFCCWIVGSPKMVVAGSLTLSILLVFHLLLLLDCREVVVGSLTLNMIHVQFLPLQLFSAGLFGLRQLSAGWIELKLNGEKKKKKKNPCRLYFISAGGTDS